MNFFQNYICQLIKKKKISSINYLVIDTFCTLFLLHPKVLLHARTFYAKIKYINLISSNQAKGNVNLNKIYTIL